MPCLPSSGIFIRMEDGASPFCSGLAFHLHMKRRSVVTACILGALALTTTALFLFRGKKPDPSLSEAYAAPTSCAQCHATEAAGYAKTGMAHAFYRPNASDSVNSPAGSRQFYHAVSGTYYSMTEHEGKYYQRRWQQGFDGKPENVEELQIDYVMGSGNHVRTYLHRESDDSLIELPLAWYAELGGHWGMNPGYDNPHPMTRRPIAYECMFCHNAYPVIPATAHRDLSANPVYSGALPEGIDCQRCHGPGAAHVKAAQTPGNSIQQISAQILNPARLSKERQMQVCEQCHLETTSRSLPDRIRHYDQQPFGYRAGQPLDRFNSYFSSNPDKGRTNNFEIVNSPYRLRQSRCYLKSQGALTCETCHNPHDLHKGTESASYYATICKTCHETGLSKQITLHQHPAANDCVSCHMPKRRTEDVVHAIMTDHLIQRNPPPSKELLADRQEIEETAANSYHGEVKRYPLDGESSHPEDSLYTALAQVIGGSNLESGIPQLTEEIRAHQPQQANFSIELGDAMRHTGNLSGALEAYRQALALDPLSSRAQRRLGVTLGTVGQPDEALIILQKAIEQEPRNALLWYERALVESNSADRTKAIADLRKALQLKPDFADAQNTLGANLAQSGDTRGAETVFRAALATNPYSAETQANLGRLLAGEADWKQAAFHLQKSVQLDPAKATAHADYAVTLLQIGRSSEAEKEAQAAVKADPKSPNAHDLLGQILAQKGQMALAGVEFEAALKLAPGFGQAQRDLAEILVRCGNGCTATGLPQRH
jgi:tetratricopeptide (TPR) repeat protein